ncbi:MAG: type II secretion system protein GspD [Brevinematales bacterium]
MKRKWIVILLLMASYCPLFSQDYSYGGPVGGESVSTEQWFQIDVPMIEEQKGNFSATFNNTSPREVFQLFGMQMGINFVISPRVSESITVAFKNVDIKDAFKTVMKMYRLYYLPEGKVIKILSQEEYRSELLNHYVETRVYDASILDLKNLPSIVKPLLTPGIGFMSVDQTASKLVIRDTRANLERLERVYNQLCDLPKMVEIETRILEVRLDDAWSAGVNWSALFSDGKWQLDILPLEKSGNTSVLRLKGSENKDGSTISADIGATLDKNHIRVISQPKVLAVNRGESTILIGNRLPYLSGTNNLALEFLDAGIKLTVRPMITPSNQVRMSLYVELSSAEWVTILPGYQAPKVQTTSLKCDVMASPGDIIVIGGLVKTEKIKRKVGVPLLGDIPLLDLLFSYQKEETIRSEMALLLVPRIVASSSPAEFSPLMKQLTNDLIK